MKIKLEIEGDELASIHDLSQRIADALNCLYDIKEQLDYRFIQVLIDILEGNDEE